MIVPNTFDYLENAIKYRQNCPVCKDKMHLSNCYEDIVSNTISLTDFEFDIVISKNNNKIVSFTERRDIQFMYDISGNIVDSIPSRNYGIKSVNGSLYKAISIECKKCDQYYYVIQMIIDINNICIKELKLNSETLSIDKLGKNTYEIKNNYITEKTQFQSFVLGNDKFMELPLIPLDLDNPSKTITKIQSLISFL